MENLGKVSESTAGKRPWEPCYPSHNLHPSSAASGDNHSHFQIAKKSRSNPDFVDHEKSSHGTSKYSSVSLSGKPTFVQADTVTEGTESSAIDSSSSNSHGNVFMH